VLWHLEGLPLGVVPPVVGLDAREHGDAIVDDQGEEEADDEAHPEADRDERTAVPSGSKPGHGHPVHLQTHAGKGEADGVLGSSFECVLGRFEYARVGAAEGRVQGCGHIVTVVGLYLEIALPERCIINLDVVGLERPQHVLLLDLVERHRDGGRAEAVICAFEGHALPLEHEGDRGAVHLGAHGARGAVQQDVVDGPTRRVGGLGEDIDDNTRRDGEVKVLAVVEPFWSAADVDGDEAEGGRKGQEKQEGQGRHLVQRGEDKNG
jgi:hypothetical protein